MDPLEGVLFVLSVIGIFYVSTGTGMYWAYTPKSGMLRFAYPGKTRSSGLAKRKAPRSLHVVQTGIIVIEGSI